MSFFYPTHHLAHAKQVTKEVTRSVDRTLLHPLFMIPCFKIYDLNLVRCFKEVMNNKHSSAANNTTNTAAWVFAASGSSAATTPLMLVT